MADSGGILAILLAGHPKLRHELRRPTMQEIGSRAALFLLEGIGEDRRAHIDWLPGACAAKGRSVAAMIDAAAIDLLAGRLRTPLQIEHHLTLAFEHGFRSGVKPASAEVPETVLSRQLHELEPRLTRHGHNVKGLAAHFHVKPAEIRLFLRGALNEERTHELNAPMRAAGRPVIVPGIADCEHARSISSTDQIIRAYCHLI